MKRFERLEFEQPTEQQQEQVGVQSARQRSVELDHDAAHWMRVAGEERRSGMHESALRLYSRALELDKSLVAGWLGQVQMLIALGEYPEAELWSRKALELFKNNPDLLAGRSQALCRSGDLKTAQASCDAAINQQGQNSFPWVARGELMLARHEDLDEHCFDKATQLDSDWLVELEIGEIYLYYNRPTKAHRRIRQAVERAPDHAYCWYRQGVCEQALGLNGAAQASFRRCLQLKPNHLAAKAGLEEVAKGKKKVQRFFQRLFRSA
jgi:tetratricopeptide (TPR) repeat protein